jgi:hypothetical protein
VSVRATGFFDGFSDPRMTSAQDYRYGTPGIDQFLLIAGVVHRFLRNFSCGSGTNIVPGRVLNGAGRNSARSASK